MITVTKKTGWIVAAVVLVVALVAAGIVFALSDDDSSAPLSPITDLSQGQLQVGDFPDGYKVESAGTVQGPATLSKLSPADCARALTAENDQNANRAGVVQFAEPPTPDLPRYQLTVLKDSASLSTIEASARACPRSVETSESGDVSVSVILTNTVRSTPSTCPVDTVLVSTRSEVTAAATMTRDFMTASVQNGRFVSQVVQEWSAPAQPDVDALCRLSTVALKRLSR